MYYYFEVGQQGWQQYNTVHKYAHVCKEKLGLNYILCIQMIDVE